MTTWSVITVLACAQFSIAVNEAKMSVSKRPLHEHPTLVKMVSRSNELRQERGLPAQRVSPELTLLAQRHAEWMAENHNFVHNYQHAYPEIIYLGAGSVDGAFQGWMNSGAHRGIILSRNGCVGYGYAVASNGQTYWCGVFGNVRDTNSNDGAE